MTILRPLLRTDRLLSIRKLHDYFFNFFKKLKVFKIGRKKGYGDVWHERTLFDKYLY